jgi:hypothetical protein
MAAETDVTYLDPDNSRMLKSIFFQFCGVISFAEAQHPQL